jgi:molybdopterin synthase sulfur carrier subunit
MKAQIKYFASIREAIGRGGEEWETSATNLMQLRAELVARGGAYADVLAPGRAVRVALNQVMADEATVLAEGAEVAFFPPVTGG